ncbi:hypothetical protein AVEN_140701-1 [Araneus ventricosus]|uniref:RNase H type-1 domain-containing protein n=1 Tax=Araneus ventricosus TaxID=182803 RepID=A0A4Y2PPK5_ARAVE|nr:hypothetical protein AVEN_140701-1 [Araneus ventricosus]
MKRIVIYVQDFIGIIRFKAVIAPTNYNRLRKSQNAAEAVKGLLQNRKVTLLTPQGRATKDQKQGCPQGSCSGPAPCNLVANEILNQVWPDNVHIQAFADDFVLVIEADTNKSLVEDTQSAITQFSFWCSENELAISTEKEIISYSAKCLVSKSNIRNEEETFFDSKAIPTLHIGSLSHHPNGSVTNYTRHPTPAHAITVPSQVYINLLPKNLFPPNITDIQSQDLETKAKGSSIHPSELLEPNQISLEDGEANIARKDIINIFTDGSKTEHGVGAAFCVLTNDIWAYQWSAKLNDNTVFQAELTALHEAVIYASHLPNHNASKIHVDNTACIMASSNSKNTNETARKIFKILLTNSRITVSWVKAHAGNIGNERAGQLAKDATHHGQPYSLIKLPKPHIKRPPPEEHA